MTTAAAAANQNGGQVPSHAGDAHASNDYLRLKRVNKDVMQNFVINSKAPGSGGGGNGALLHHNDSIEKMASYHNQHPNQPK